MIETAVAIIATCLPTLRTLVYGVKPRTGTSSLGGPSNGRHYQLGSAKGGITSTNIAGGSRMKSRTSTLRPSNNDNWPLGASNIGKDTDDSDDELFLPIDAQSTTRSNHVEIDPRTLGVLPEAKMDRVYGDRARNPCENKSGIMVTTAFRVQSESTRV